MDGVHVDRIHYRSHEAGDEKNIPETFFNDKLLDPEARPEELPRLYHALAVSKRQGYSRSLTIGNEYHLLTAEGRGSTFTPEWHGPHYTLMAKAGLYCCRQGNVVCVSCPVRFRPSGWCADEDPMKKHGDYSCNCRFLKLAKTQTRTELYLSYTSLQMLTK